MKVVVFGPRKRTGALIEGSVVDLSHGYAKYLRERTSEPSPLEMVDVVVPSDLTRLIVGPDASLLRRAARVGGRGCGARFPQRSGAGRIWTQR